VSQELFAEVQGNIIRETGKTPNPKHLLFSRRMPLILNKFLMFSRRSRYIE
jgi:hypothetical protein